MSGNGFYDNTSGEYTPKSVETWDDFDASSAGLSWDGYTEWQATPLLPLTFTTRVIDFGSSVYLNYLVTVSASNAVNLTVYYSDTVDSAGALVSPSNVSVTPNTANLDAKKGRYWQVTVSCDRDSASLPLPTITNITTRLSARTIEEVIQSLDSSTLGGSTGIRQLSTLTSIGTISTLVAQPHSSAGAEYVESSYVSSGYVEAATTKIPAILIDKTTSPPTLNIYDINASNSVTDCVFDAVIKGLPKLSSNSAGNTVEAT